MFITLQAGEKTDFPIRGKTIAYLSGATQLRFDTSEGSAQIPSGGQVKMTNTFTHLYIENKGSAVCVAELLIVEGDYSRLSDVSIVQIQGITNTINSQVTNEVSVKISEALDAHVLSLPEVVNKDVDSCLTTAYKVTPEGNILIPAKTGRKRLLLQGYTESLETTICRVSDSGKIAITGQFFAVGGGLMAELEYKHSAALKVWNPSTTDSVEISVMEEFNGV